MSTTREDCIQGLRDLADFLEQRPAVPVPVCPQLNVFVDADKLREIARAASWEKVYLGDWFVLRGTFGPVELDITVERDQVCKRIVVGQKVIPARPEQTVDVVEWECAEPIMAGQS